MSPKFSFPIFPRPAEFFGNRPGVSKFHFREFPPAPGVSREWTSRLQNRLSEIPRGRGDFKKPSPRPDLPRPGVRKAGPRHLPGQGHRTGPLLRTRRVVLRQRPTEGNLQGDDRPPGPPPRGTAYPHVAARQPAPQPVVPRRLPRRRGSRPIFPHPRRPQTHQAGLPPRRHRRSPADGTRRILRRPGPGEGPDTGHPQLRPRHHRQPSPRERTTPNTRTRCPKPGTSPSRQKPPAPEGSTGSCTQRHKPHEPKQLTADTKRLPPAPLPPFASSRQRGRTPGSEPPISTSDTRLNPATPPARIRDISPNSQEF